MRPKRILRALGGVALITLLVYGSLGDVARARKALSLAQWMTFDVVLMVCCCAGLVALVNRADELAEHSARWQEASAREVFRSWLVDGTLAIFGLSVMGFIGVSLAIAVSKGKPPIAWGRIGGVITDWVIYVCLLLPLSLGVIFATGASFVVRRLEGPGTLYKRVSEKGEKV